MAVKTPRKAVAKTPAKAGANLSARPTRVATAAAKPPAKPAAKPARKVAVKAAAKPAGTVVKAANADAKAPAKTSSAVSGKAAAKASAASRAASAKPTSAAPAREKAVNVRPVRDSFTMPANEYQALGDLKKACIKAGFEVKKSQLLRAGVALLQKLDVAQLKQVLAGLPALQAGRPKKNK